MEDYIPISELAKELFKDGYIPHKCPSCGLEIYTQEKEPKCPTCGTPMSRE